MATALVAQTTGNPTRKLTAATIAGFITALIQLVVTNFFPDQAPLLQEPFVASLITTGVAFLSGYMVKDRATVTVVQ